MGLSCVIVSVPASTADASASSSGGWRYEASGTTGSGAEAASPPPEPALEPSEPSEASEPSEPTPSTASLSPAPEPTPPLDGVEELLLQVELNGRKTQRTVLALSNGNDQILLGGEDLEALGMIHPDVEPVMHHQMPHFPLGALEGVTYNVDMRTLDLMIEAPASAMQSHAVDAGEWQYTAPDEPATGVFINHDLVATVDESEETANGVFEVGLFGGFGSLRSSQLVRDLVDNPEVTRLDTTWRWDSPASMRTLRVGDAIGYPGAWGRAVRFGGIQWGTNFATRPDFVTFPLPSLEGETALPSTVDVYIDNTRRFSREIPAGPFTIDDVPVVSGSGEVELVVRDLLGRERTIVQPYYAASRLLRDGLHEYSYELGSERQRFGERSADYGRVFAALTHRLGITDYVTGELRAETVEDEQQTAGAALTVLWPATGVWSLAVAGSQRDDETGSSLSLGFERQGNRFSLGGSIQFNEAEFTQLGLEPDASAPGRTVRLFVGTRVGGRGSLSLSYIDRFNRDEEDVRFAQASFAWGLGRFGSLRLAALYPWDGEDDPTFSLSYSRSLDNQRSLHGEARAGDGTSVEARLQRSAPPGPGSGYSLAAEAGDREVVYGRYIRNTSHGAYSAEAESADGNEAIRVGADGSLVWMGGAPMAARNLGDAFAVVEVPGQAGVDVYRNNQVVATTGADGRAIVHGLLPYDQNPVRIDPRQLPLDVQPAETQWRTTPRYGTGVRLLAEAEKTNGAVFRIVGEDGDPLPAGTVIRHGGSGELFPVGRNGLAYVTGLQETTQLEAAWRDSTCRFELRYTPDSNEPLPDLGEVVCRQGEAL